MSEWFNRINTALKSKKPSKHFEQWDKNGDLKIALPEIAILREVPQDRKYHPEGNVWNHTMRALDFYEGDIIGRWALLFHDLGKRTTHKKSHGSHKFPEHARESVKIATKIMNRIGVPKAMQSRIRWLVQIHNDYYKILEMDAEKLKELAKKPDFPIYMRVAYADEGSRGREPKSWIASVRRLKDLAEFDDKLKPAAKQADKVKLVKGMGDSPSPTNPWEMTRSQYIKRNPLPEMSKLPQEGTYPAIRTDDNSLYHDPDPQHSTHYMFAQKRGIPFERIEGGGWIANGVYNESHRSDSSRIGEQARAKARVEHRMAVHNARKKGIPVPKHVLADYPELGKADDGAPMAPVKQPQLGETHVFKNNKLYHMEPDAWHPVGHSGSPIAHEDWGTHYQQAFPHYQKPWQMTNEEFRRNATSYEGHKYKNELNEQFLPAFVPHQWKSGSVTYSFPENIHTPQLHQDIVHNAILHGRAVPENVRAEHPGAPTYQPNNYQKEPWEMTKEEWLDPYHKPREGHRMLYSVKHPEHAEDIRQQGMLTSKATGYEAPKGMLWSTKGPEDYAKHGALVEFEVPENDPNINKVNSTDFTITRDIDPREIRAIHKPHPFPKEFERDWGEKKQRLDQFRRHPNWHELYVQDALDAGKPVPKEVLAQYPDLQKPMGKSIVDAFLDLHKEQLGLPGMRYEPPRPHNFSENNKISSDKDYLYHATTADRAADIAGSGLGVHKPWEHTDQEAWPDGAVEKRNYFIGQAPSAQAFIPEGDHGVIMRVRRDAHPFKRESTGDFYSNKPVHPSKVEMMSNQGNWHPVGHFYPQDMEKSMKPEMVHMKKSQMDFPVTGFMSVRKRDLAEHAASLLNKSLQDLLKGKEAQLGEIHRWKDGNLYQKVEHGWVPVRFSDKQSAWQHDFEGGRQVVPHDVWGSHKDIYANADPAGEKMGDPDMDQLLGMISMNPSMISKAPPTPAPAPSPVQPPTPPQQRVMAQPPTPPPTPPPSEPSAESLSPESVQPRRVVPPPEAIGAMNFPTNPTAQVEIAPGYSIDAFKVNNKGTMMAAPTPLSSASTKNDFFAFQMIGKNGEPSSFGVYYDKKTKNIYLGDRGDPSHRDDQFDMITFPSEIDNTIQEFEDKSRSEDDYNKVDFLRFVRQNFFDEKGVPKEQVAQHFQAHSSMKMSLYRGQKQEIKELSGNKASYVTHMGGGVNATKIVKTKSGIKAVCKAAFAGPLEFDTKNGDITHGSPFCEAAAFNLAALLGFKNVPTTGVSGAGKFHWIDADGNPEKSVESTPKSMQKFIESPVDEAGRQIPRGKRLMDDLGSRERAKINKLDLANIFMLDLIGGNSDRHAANVLCVADTSGKYRAYAIDNAACFWPGRKYQDRGVVSRFMPSANFNQVKIPTETRNRLKEISLGDLETHIQPLIANTYTDRNYAVKWGGQKPKNPVEMAAFAATNTKKALARIKHLSDSIEKNNGYLTMNEVNRLNSMAERRKI